MTSVRLSRDSIVFLKPHKASLSLMLIFMTKLSFCLWKTLCSLWSNTMITSPGSSPGSWSPSPWNVIFWPSFMPKARIGQGRFVSQYLGDHFKQPVGKEKPTFVNVDLEDFLLALHFVPIAVFAAVLGVEFFTLSIAVWTHALDLLDHARPNLLHPYLYSLSFAGGALLQGTLLPAVPCCNDKQCYYLKILTVFSRLFLELLTFTFFTNDILLETKLPCGAIVNFLKRNLKLMNHVLSFGENSVRVNENWLQKV